MSSVIDRPHRDAAVVLRGPAARDRAGKTGRVLDRAAATGARSSQALAGVQHGERVALPVQLDRARGRGGRPPARRSRQVRTRPLEPVRLTLAPASWRLPRRRQLAAILGSPRDGATKLDRRARRRALLQAARPRVVNRPAQNASSTFTRAARVTVVPARLGRVLDVAGPPSDASSRPRSRRPSATARVTRRRGDSPSARPRRRAAMGITTRRRAATRRSTAASRTESTTCSSSRASSTAN